MKAPLHDTIGLILGKMDDAEREAWRALGGYKFWMFGYHAAAWVKYNQLLPASDKKSNPFREAVRLGRTRAAL